MPELLQAMSDNGVTHALCVSVDLPDFPQVLALAEQYPHIYASVGVHPDYEDTEEPSAEQLVALSQHPKLLPSAKPGWITSGLRGIWSGSVSVFASIYAHRE